MRKSAPTKLTLQRETLRQLGTPLSNLAGGRPGPGDTAGAEPTCVWYSELYSACTCPPSWWDGCTSATC